MADLVEQILEVKRRFTKFKFWTYSISQTRCIFITSFERFSNFHLSKIGARANEVEKQFQESPNFQLNFSLFGYFSNTIRLIFSFIFFIPKDINQRGGIFNQSSENRLTDRFFFRALILDRFLRQAFLEKPVSILSSGVKKPVSQPMFRRLVGLASQRTNPVNVESNDSTF